MPRVLPDSNDVCVWLCNDTGTSILNSGTAGASGHLTLGGGTDLIPGGAPSVFGEKALVTPGSLTSKASYISPNPATSNIEPALPISLSGWFFLRNQLNSQNYLISPMKNYRTAQNTWTGPFSWGIIGFSSAATWGAIIIISGGQQTLSIADNFPLPFGRWCHIGMTYDGVNQRAYLNGDLAGSTARSGAIDYGTHGPWAIGSNWSTGTANGEQPACIRCDWRLANIARPQSYFKDIYLNGLFGFGGTTLQRYYRLQATDLACDPPENVYWTDTQYSLNNAPVGPCGTPGTSLANLKILETWEQ